MEHTEINSNHSKRTHGNCLESAPTLGYHSFWEQNEVLQAGDLNIGKTWVLEKGLQILVVSTSKKHGF